MCNVTIWRWPGIHTLLRSAVDGPITAVSVYAHTTGQLLRSFSFTRGGVTTSFFRQLHLAADAPAGEQQGSAAQGTAAADDELRFKSALNLLGRELEAGEKLGEWLGHVLVGQ